MHAFLYSKFDFLSSLNTLVIEPETSIGIDQIRQAQKFLSILPPEDQINRLVILQAEKMTVPAQNAFLKTLEEPPAQSEIYLVTDFPDQLLPTILSRVEIKLAKNSYTSDSLEDSRKLWAKLQNASVGECLAVIDESAFDRESFLQFLNDLEFILHENLNSSSLPLFYSLLSDTRKYTTTNCNLRLVQDFFVFNLVAH